MSDLISRRALCEYALNQGKSITPNEIMRFPSAEPVKHGKWINTHEKDEWYCTVYKCSVCGCEILGKGYKFCGGCGARMDEK